MNETRRTKTEDNLKTVRQRASRNRNYARDVGRPTNIVVERLQACNYDNVSNYRASNSVAQLATALMSADSHRRARVRAGACLLCACVCHSSLITSTPYLCGSCFAAGFIPEDASEVSEISDCEMRERERTPLARYPCFGTDKNNNGTSYIKLI